MIRKLAQQEPALTCSVLSWGASAVCALAGRPEFSPVLVAVGLVFLGVRAQVTPVKKSEAQVIQAAEQAAHTVASGITETTAGTAGVVTEKGQQLVNDAVGLVKNLLGVKG